MDQITCKAFITKIKLIVLISLFGVYGSSCSNEKGKLQQANNIEESLDIEITDVEILDLVQLQTFNYFWDGAHPSSGMALERTNGDGKTVTSGGSGFGVMAIIVGVHRDFITREQAVERLLLITNFLMSGDRFHGAFPHWYNGDTGKVEAFSEKDNGGDIVETSFMIQGLLAARQYFDQNNEEENILRLRIKTLWDEVEWDWYVQTGTTYITWHWSPNYGFEINHKLDGYNEALITYILAASSETHPIDAEVYHEGWAKNGDIANGTTYYNKYVLPLGTEFGGPLFFAHYSFMGLDPNGLVDRYANYWEQNVAHTLINREYCVQNPKNWNGYGPDVWGLTASDGNNGYSAHSPVNDRGVITPTAALSSFPYTPEYSMEFLRNLYGNKKAKLWGPYGFYDAFNETEDWVAPSYLAIDQGPIVVMIENYRSQLVWNAFMSSPDVQAGLKKLEFVSPHF